MLDTPAIATATVEHADDIDLHGKVPEEILQLVVGGGVGQVSNIQSPAFSGGRGVGGISLRNVGPNIGGLGGDGSVLDSFGDGLDGGGGNLANSGNNGFGGVCGHDELDAFGGQRG